MESIESRKSAEKAEGYLTEGDTCHHQSKYFEALISYNKCLCFDRNHKFSSFAFANRSAVYLEIKMYEKCLENIKLARAYHYPFDEKLDETEAICKHSMDNLSDPGADPWEFFKLSYPQNKRMPFVTECLELKDTWKFGRCIITNRELNTGDVIAIEEPFLKMLNVKSRYNYCVTCFKSNAMSLLPCPGSCTTSMFCSNECIQLGLKRFHKYECKSLDSSLDTDNTYDIMIQKSFFESIYIAGGLAKLQTLLSDHRMKKTVYDFDLTNPKRANHERSLLQTVCSLMKGPTSAEDKEIIDFFVDTHPGFTSLWKTQEQHDFIKKFIATLMGVIDRNSYLYYSLQDQLQEVEIGSGVFPFCSLVNHSCSPNVYRAFVENKQVFVVKKPIARGHQLFVGYQPNFYILAREQRQSFLKNDFQFRCTCEACSGNFPLLRDLKRIDDNFIEPKVNAAESIEEAKKLFSENCKYIESFKNEYPCYEICCLMQNNHRQLCYIAAGWLHNFKLSK